MTARRLRRRRRRDHRPGRRVRVAPAASGRRDRRPRGRRPDRRQAAPGRAGRALVRHRPRGGARPRARGRRGWSRSSAWPTGWSRRRRPRPPSSCPTAGTRCRPGTVLGVPASADGLDGLPLPGRRRAGARRGRRCRRCGSTATSPSARLLRERLGDEVVDRLVEPLLGGVYAGRADELSLAATMPALAAQLPGGRVGAGRRGGRPRTPASRSRGDADGPVFATVADGIGVAARRAGRGRPAPRSGCARRRTACAGRRPGFELSIGPAAAPELLTADAVLVTAPGAEGRPAAGRGWCPARSSRCRASRTRRWPWSRWRSRPRTSPPGRGCSCRR